MSQTTTLAGRELFHRILNSKPNPERAYALLSRLAEAATEPSADPKLTDRANSGKNLRDLAKFLHATGQGHEAIAMPDALLSARKQEGGETE